MQVGAPDGWPWGAARTATNARRTLRAKERGCISFVMVFWKKSEQKMGGARNDFISSESVQGGRDLNATSKNRGRFKSVL